MVGWVAVRPSSIDARSHVSLLPPLASLCPNQFAYSPDADLTGTPLEGLTDPQKQIIAATVHVRNNVKQFLSKVKP